jgi:hypothetical protein
MTAPTAAPWVLRCPVCSTPVPPGAPPSTPCPTCGLPAAAHAGLVVGRIGVTLADLHRDRDALLATLRTAAPGPRRPPTPPPAPPAPAPYAPSPSAPTYPAPAAGPEPERRRVSPQQVLVGLGALLVVAASLALVAVAWTRFGIGFQAGVMATATAAAAVGSGWAARRGLRATEEGLAATAAALLLVDVGAARSLGLLGLDAVDGRVYAAVAAGVVAVLTAGLAARTRSTLVWPAVALLAAQPVLLLALGDLVDGVLGVAALLVVAVADGRVAGVLPRWSAEVARVLAGVAAAAAAARAVALAWTGSPVAGAGATALVTAAAVAAAVVLVRRAERGHPAGAPWAVAGLAAVPALAVAGLVQPAGDVAAPLLAVAGLAAACAAVLLWSSPLRREVAGGPAVALVAVGTTQLVLADRPAALALVALVAAVPAALAAVTHRAARAAGTALALLLPGVAVLAAPEGDVLGTSAAGLLLALLAAAALGAATTRLGAPEERAAALAAVVLAAAATGTGASVGAWGQVGAQLALVGGAALAHSVAGRRTVTGWIALADLVAAAWVALAGAAVVTTEAYSLPLAAALLVAAGPRLVRGPSWQSWGPALLVGFAPSLVTALAADQPLRTLLVGLAGVVALVAGTWAHRQAPFLVGAVTVGVLGVVELAPWVGRLDSWVPLGAAGLLLLVVGATYEQRRQQAREAVAWVSQLR